MVYEYVSSEKPIKQADIFESVPRVEFSLDNLPILGDDEETHVTTWRDAVQSHHRKDPLTAIVAIESVTAIVITQDCDASHGTYIALCPISEYEQTLRLSNPPATPKKWAEQITKTSRKNLRFFYLPMDETQKHFSSRMVVDFRDIIRVSRYELEAFRDKRIARLNHTAAEHFRETLGQFFRRYPYNEWYPLTKEEFEAYAAKSPSQVEPYDWQK